MPERAFSSAHMAFDLGSHNGLAIGEHKIARRRPVPPDATVHLPTGMIRVRAGS